MYGEVGTKAFCRTKPSEGEEILISCVRTEGGKGTKGHGRISVALYFDALYSCKFRLKNRMTS